MKRYEVRIKILDKNYVDSLIVALARQGYDVYLNADVDYNIVCYTTDENEITEIKK